MEQPLPLSPQQARLLTDRIVTTPGGRWTRIAEAHTRGVASALGYPTWEAYCDAEFGPERFRIPHRQRHQVLAELKDAGMSYEDVEAAVIPQNRARERYAAPPQPLPLPAGSVGDEEAGDGEAPGVDELFGFTSAELELIGALLEVDDKEFNRVLAAGHHHHDLSPDFVREQCRLAIQARETVGRNLDRALRSVERAHGLVERGLHVTGELQPGARDLLRLLEDEAWDLIDTIDRLNVRLDHGAARHSG